MTKDNLKKLILSKISNQDFIHYLHKHEMILNPIGEYDQLVDSMCHHSCEWATKVLNKNLSKDILNNLYWCVGEYTYVKDELLIVAEHSWLEYRNKSGIIIIDLTISQFDSSFDKIYIEYKTNNYSMAKNSIKCDSNFNLNQFTRLICMV